MDLIEAAIEAIESLKPREHFTYSQIAKIFSVVRTTLSQRHRGICQSRELAHKKLHPQQEIELVQYIQGLTKRRTPPKRQIIRNFASCIAGKDVSDS